MRIRCIAAWLAGIALAAAPARADGRNPGSLLLYPEFDSTAGRATLLTLTDVNPDAREGSVRVEIVFINATPATGGLCSETNTTVTLTPNDTLTFLASALNPNPQKGYVYAFAKNAAGQAIAFDWLAGGRQPSVVFDGVHALDYLDQSVQLPCDPDAGPRNRPRRRRRPRLERPRVRDGAGQDLRPALRRPEHDVPERTGDDRAHGRSAVHDDTRLRLQRQRGGVLEELRAFRCWTKVPLTTISNTFLQSFLANSTSHAPGENDRRDENVETELFEIDGRVACRPAPSSRTRPSWPS